MDNLEHGIIQANLVGVLRSHLRTIPLDTWPRIPTSKCGVIVPKNHAFSMRKKIG